jgi:diketogulonate reductase-like aldo/keto reductase
MSTSPERSRAPSVTLNTGAALPSVGLGVFRASPEDTYRAVTHALRVGYRHIDTAQVYGNEEPVGRAVRDSGLPREDVFVTTKLWNDFQREGMVERAFEDSVRRLGLGAPDLFLLHWPVPRLRLGAWKVLERLQREQRVRAIGVSNFMANHLRELLAAAEVVPAVNQIEVSPFLQQREVRALCREHGIVVEAYSPLTKGQRLAHPVVLDVARRLNLSPAQVLLRWGIQHGLVVLPKSVTPARIEENLALFDTTLDDAAMAQLDALEENLVTGWNPQRER